MVDPRMDAYRVSSLAIGIDVLRSQYIRSLGVYVAEPTAQFRAGQLVQMNASQKVIICDGTVPFGFAKYNKVNTLYATIVGEYIQLNGVVPTNLKHGSLFVPGAAGGVRVGAALTGAAYTEGAGNDYTVNYTNGQITRVAAGTIVDGSYVYVNYMYLVTDQDLDFEGRNFYNFINDVDIQTGRVTIINDWSLIFTAMYDPSQTYSVNDQLTAGTVAANLSGYVTKGGAGAYIGRVFQPPTATDPFLGIRYVGGMLS